MLFAQGQDNNLLITRQIDALSLKRITFPGVCTDPGVACCCWPHLVACLSLRPWCWPSHPSHTWMTWPHLH